MAEKAIVYKVPEEVRKQSIETLKVRQETLDYLRKKGLKPSRILLKNKKKYPKNTEVIFTLI